MTLAQIRTAPTSVLKAIVGMFMRASPQVREAARNELLRRDQNVL